jgi:hypothetical protein
VSLCKSDFFGILLKDAFKGDDTEDSFGNYLREYILAKLRQNREFVGPLTSVLWDFSVLRTYIAHRGPLYFRLTWQMIKLWPATSDLFRQKVFSDLFSNFRSHLNFVHGPANPALYVFARTLAAFNFAYYSENKDSKSFSFFNKITSLTRDYKNSPSFLRLLVSALSASAGLSHGETAICRLIASIAGLGRELAEGLFAELKARKGAVHLDVPPRSLAWAVRMVAIVCQCRRQFDPKPEKEFPQITELMVREFVAPGGTFAVLRPLFAELVVTAPKAPAVFESLVTAVDNVFERTETMETVGPEVPWLLAIIGDKSQATRWGERAAEVVAAEVRAALASEETVEVAKAARSVAAADDFLNVLERREKIEGRPIKLDDTELQRFIEVLTRQSEEKVQEVCSVIAEWRLMRISHCI